MHMHCNYIRTCISKMYERTYVVTAVTLRLISRLHEHISIHHMIMIMIHVY